MRLALLLTLGWLGRASDEDAKDTEELDTMESCWAEDPLGSGGSWARYCCRPKPCGQGHCWVPPMYTYEFCCDEGACRTLTMEEVKRALDVAVESLPNTNASLLAFRAAPEAFRSMRELKAQLSTPEQACMCSVAFAVATLLWYPEDSNTLDAAIKPRWFLDGMDWGQILAEGWGSLFKWLDRFPHEGGPHGEHPSHSSHQDFEDLAERRQSLLRFIQSEQAEARLVVAGMESEKSGDLSISDVIRELRRRDVFKRIWDHVLQDLAWRRRGQKCVVAKGKESDSGRWLACEPWDYHSTANFSSVLPSVEGRDGLGDGLGKSNVAVCVLGAPRTVVKTYEGIRQKVVGPLDGDTFIYVPFSDMFTPLLEEDLKALGRAVTAIVVPDVNRSTFEDRTFSEFYDSRLWMLYAKANGPWRAPLYRQMGSSMWGYHNQHCCRRMVESFEQQRGWEYEWVVFARAEMFWVQPHPPIQVLSPEYVHIPMGQDNSYYNFNDLKGINDRHAVVPKRWFKSYFNRWESLLDGRAWKYLAKVAKEGYMINTEQYLWLHLQAEGVQVRRFPPVSFLSHCTEGPQCQHLYKGTDLGKVRWTQTAKYWTELLESRRTIVDDYHYVKRPEKGWIWVQLWPHSHWIWGSVSSKDAARPLQELEPQELLNADLACGLSKHGPISSLRWVFFLRCECHA